MGWAAAACAVFAALAAIVLMGLGERVTWPGEAPTALRAAASIVSATASLEAALLVLVAAALLERISGRGLSGAVTLAAALVASMAAVYALKVSIRAPRPSMLYSGYAFPSGHSARAAVIASWVSSRSRRRWATILAWAWAAAVAWSRLVLHAHWLCDVTAGLALGYCVERATELVFNRRVYGRAGRVP